MTTHTLRLFLSYLGTDFCGFQSQENLRSVQKEIEKAIEKITGQSIRIVGAGRTDAGVHAANQAASFCAEGEDINLGRLTKGLNAVLPKDIAIHRIDKMPEGFNAKNHSIGKQYIYKIYNQIGHDPFLSKFTLNIKHLLDIDKMNEAASFLLGDQDFESFRNKNCTAKHARRYLWHALVSKSGPLISIDIRGNAFCFNMVRIITGTLIEIGLKKRAPKEVTDILLAKDRTKAGITAKPHGLTLARVYYPDDLTDSLIPMGASFPRYPVAQASWPFLNKDIVYGPMTLSR